MQCLLDPKLHRVLRTNDLAIIDSDSQVELCRPQGNNVSHRLHRRHHLLLLGF